MLLNLVKIISGYILFFISNIGYWEYFRKKTRMNIYFIPAFIVSLQTTILFCSGLLNCLGVTSTIIFVIGLLLAVYYLFTNFKNTIHVYLNVGYIFLAIAVFLVIIAVCGKVFTHTDNFSHWAFVVKNMLETNRYPSFRDTLIWFKTYPLGSSTYIYYVAKIVSNSEQTLMFAQAYFMLSLILPAFKYVKKNKIANCIYIILFTNYIFSYHMQIYDLLVDTLLPLQGMATTFFIYSECLGLDTRLKKGNVSIIYAIPFLCTLMQIKNSAIFFVAIACIVILVSLKYEKSEIWKKAITVLAPFLSFYFWKAHCEYVFIAASTSAHSISVDNYKNHISTRTGQEIWSIFINVLKFSVKGKELIVFFITIVLIGLLIILRCDESRNNHLKVFLSSICLYIIYMMGLFFTYAFSMSEEEAAKLTASERYRSTIFIAIYYLILLVSLLTISELENIKQRWIYTVAVYGMFMVLCVGRSIPYGTPFITIFTYNDKKDALEENIWFRKAINENSVSEEKSYIICCPSVEASNYAKRVCRYLLYSDTLSERVITEISQLNDAKDYDYIFVYDGENEIIQEWINVNYPDQVGKSVIMTGE